MGVATDGILCFGCVIGGDEQEEDHTDRLAALDPDLQDEEYDGSGCPSEGLYHLAQSEEQWSGLTLVNTCSLGCPMWVLTHEDLCWRAKRGLPVQVNPADLACPPDVLDKMKRLCELFEIPWTEPAWLLGSYWEKS